MYICSLIYWLNLNIFGYDCIRDIIIRKLPTKLDFFLWYLKKNIYISGLSTIRHCIALRAWHRQRKLPYQIRRSKKKCWPQNVFFSYTEFISLHFVRVCVCVPVPVSSPPLPYSSFKWCLKVCSRKFLS